VLLRRLTGPRCARCGAPTAWPVARCNECAGRRLAFASARSAVAYDTGAKALVSAWKERGLRGLASDAGTVVAEVVPRPRAYTITFVPPDADRLLERGYHPAEALARALATHWELPVVGLLERTRPAPPQRGLGLAQRRANVRGAFRARGRAPTRVVLVDDVYTSGATAAAAASALRRAGSRHVDVITFARAVR
jgi:predicted amidophosphoribosyltransferase